MPKLKCQYFGHLIQRADLLEKTLMLGRIEGRQRRRQQSMRSLASITDSEDMNLSKLQQIVEDKGARSAAAHGIAKSRTQFSELTTWSPGQPHWESPDPSMGMHP